MIPISLKLKGIYSYQDKEQLIDFQQLCDAGLFGIFGAVGSGKSTILEAVSFALYGETERLNKRENRGYNMMNLKSDHLLIDFVFKNGAGEKYRFVVKGKRNAKKFEDVKTFSREAFVEKEKEWQAVSANSAEEITGLSYINFRRTIIIPQGRFQEFLQLGDTDRTKMMKELFHLERFDLSVKTKLLEEKNNSKLTHLEGQLLQLEEVSKEKIEDADKKIKQLAAEVKKNQELQKEFEGKETALKALKELFGNIQLAEKELEGLKKQQSGIEKLKKELKEFQYCRIHFKSKIEKLSRDKKKAASLKKELEDAEKEFTDLNEQLVQLETEYEEVKQQYDAKEEINRKAESYKKLLKIKELKTEASTIQQRINKGNSTIEECNAAIEKLEADLKAVKEVIARLKEQEIDMAVLAKIKSWYNELTNLENGLKEAEEQIGENKKQEEEKLAALDALLQEIGFNKGNASMGTEIEDFCQKKHRSFESDLEEVNEELKQLKVKQELSSYAENLQEGEACPVCGSAHHPEKMKVEDFSLLNQKLSEQAKKIKRTIEEFNESEKQIALKISECKLLAAQLAEINGKRSAVEKKVENHRTNKDPEWNYQEHQIEEEFKKAEKEKNRLRALEKQLVELESNYSREQKNKEKYQLAVNQLENDLASKKSSHNTLLQQIEPEGVDEVIKLENETIKKEIAVLLSGYKQLVENFQRVDGSIKKIRPVKDKLAATIDIKGNDFNELKNELAREEEALNKELLASAYTSVEAILEILKKDFVVEQEEEKIQSFENKLFSITEQLLKLKQQAEDKSFNQEEYDLVLAELEALKNKISQQNKELGSYEKEKREYEGKLIEKEKLTEKSKVLNKRAENLKVLKNLFKASGFVNYVSSVYLQNLVNAANRRFSVLTQQKLRLELTETNDFIIRDYLNEGKIRSVKTLSGGQTFQASLSLALALADNIQAVAKSANNFFFLDEGFGSLDKESLSLVFQSLKSLRKEKRTVGVISHVEELQQEIDSFLKIENDPETGTRIFGSWE